MFPKATAAFSERKKDKYFARRSAVYAGRRTFFRCTLRQRRMLLLQTTHKNGIIIKTYFLQGAQACLKKIF
jgi:hypothetical protein